MSSAAAADADADQNGVRPIDSNWANDITEIEIPTGIPLVYHLDKNLNVIPNPRAAAPLSGEFLVDPEELAKAQAAVAVQPRPFCRQTHRTLHAL